MSLEGSKTHENLKAAFAGESSESPLFVFCSCCRYRRIS